MDLESLLLCRAISEKIMDLDIDKKLVEPILLCKNKDLLQKILYLVSSGKSEAQIKIYLEKLNKEPENISEITIHDLIFSQRGDIEEITMEEWTMLAAKTDSIVEKEKQEKGQHSVPIAEILESFKIVKIEAKDIFKLIDKIYSIKKVETYMIAKKIMNNRLLLKSIKENKLTTDDLLQTIDKISLIKDTEKQLKVSDVINNKDVCGLIHSGKLSKDDWSDIVDEICLITNYEKLLIVCDIICDKNLCEMFQMGRISKEDWLAGIKKISSIEDIKTCQITKDRICCPSLLNTVRHNRLTMTDVFQEIDQIGSIEEEKQSKVYNIACNVTISSLIIQGIITKNDWSTMIKNLSSMENISNLTEEDVKAYLNTMADSYNKAAVIDEKITLENYLELCKWSTWYKHSDIPSTIEETPTSRIDSYIEVLTGMIERIDPSGEKTAEIQKKKQISLMCIKA